MILSLLKLSMDFSYFFLASSRSCSCVNFFSMISFSMGGTHDLWTHLTGSDTTRLVLAAVEEVSMLLTRFSIICFRMASLTLNSSS